MELVLNALKFKTQSLHKLILSHN